MADQHAESPAAKLPGSRLEAALTSEKRSFEQQPARTPRAVSEALELGLIKRSDIVGGQLPARVQLEVDARVAQHSQQARGQPIQRVNVD